MDRRQAPQVLHQVGGDGDIPPPLALVARTSGLREMIGGSWESRRSDAQRDRHSETRSPVRSMMRMAIRTG